MVDLWVGRQDEGSNPVPTWMEGVLVKYQPQAIPNGTHHLAELCPRPKIPRKTRQDGHKTKTKPVELYGKSPSLACVVIGHTITRDHLYRGEDSLVGGVEQLKQ
ncbi:hypothetical protein BDN72DRAFT_850198 [Pluteus cervinus]|uniref:Uncharacterized protein n=1 Tax=Pluteus cervinus TaxID=181527 RepID=A0ACD3A5A9_9AGAR|nr:hypothetical protein BDN72DRAFT_850198 [Pluteus cervinus]